MRFMIRWKWKEYGDSGYLHLKSTFTMNTAVENGPEVLMVFLASYMMIEEHVDHIHRFMGPGIGVSSFDNLRISVQSGKDITSQLQGYLLVCERVCLGSILRSS
jgi:hypothetical protein